MATAQHEIRKSRPRALIVDDSQIARYVLCGQLMSLGFDVDVANSAESALKQLTGPLPDVVFMDHLLPGMNGLEAVRRLREQPRSSRTPIVMYTSQDSEAFARRSRETGADDIYVKTEDESSLQAILANLDLLPEATEASAADSNVLPIRGSGQVQKPPATDILADLPDRLAPIMDAQYEKLRRDLLAEFTILERYEERMRRDLFRKVEVVTQGAVETLGRSVARARDDTTRSRTSPGRWLAMAASLLVAVGISVAVAFGVEQRMGELELQNASTQAALESQMLMLEDLRDTVIVQATRVSAEAVEAREVAMPVPAADDGGYAPAPTAVDALVAELQGMGILGSVRIQTSAGSFCIGSSPSGFRMESSGVSLADCEVLPVLISAANW